MTFRYTPILHQGSRRDLPLLSVQVGGVIDVFALLDSGSEHNIFNIDVAQELDIALGKAEPVVFGGYGSKKLSGALVDVDLGINLDGTVHQWRGPVIFSKAARDRAVLGQEGFFEFFDVVFRRRVREFEVRESKRK